MNHMKSVNAVLPGGLVKKSRISHWGCIDPMVGATIDNPNVRMVQPHSMM